MSELSELQGKVEALESKLSEKDKELEGLQSLKGKWSNEVGDVRKKSEDLAKTIEALKAALDEATGDRDALKSEIESLKSKSGGKDGQPPPAKKPSGKEEADRLESELTDDEKKLVEKILTGEGEEAKKSFVSDDEFRAAVLRQARAGNSDGGPSSIWRVKKQESGDSMLKKVEEMFKKHKGQDTAHKAGGRFGQAREVKSADALKPVVFV